MLHSSQADQDVTESVDWIRKWMTRKSKSERLIKMQRRKEEMLKGSHAL